MKATPHLYQSTSNGQHPFGNHSSGENRNRPRIALYSHDTQGLGHVRRNLLIAKSLSRNGECPVILMLCGVHEAAAFTMPDGVDCLTLPSLSKNTEGDYSPRSLHVSRDELVDLRSRTIAAALRSFEPDVFVVDKVPLGAFAELRSGLEMLRAKGQTRIILGLREILDDPATVQREWRQGKYAAAIRRYYHRVWVYGDKSVFDPVVAYDFPADVAEKVRYTGYLSPLDGQNDKTEFPDSVDFVDQSPKDRPSLALCVVGGGQDGVPLAEAFLNAKLPHNSVGLLITGPMMPEAARMKFKTLVEQRDDMHILEFVTNPVPYMEQADAMISMGGYNTTCEILSTDVPALIVPRINQRTEQLIRARCLSQLGALDMLHPDTLSGENLSEWLNKNIGRTITERKKIDLQGSIRLPQFLHEALGTQDATQETLHATA